MRLKDLGIRNWKFMGQSTLASIGSVFLILIGVTTLCYFGAPWIGYRAVGFFYLVIILVIGLFFDLSKVLFSAFLSTILWNLLFIPPKFTFNIAAPEDLILCFCYFLAALTTGWLTHRNRQQAHKLLLAENLKESERVYKAILNSVSHELRTPLTTIIAAASALENETLKADSIQNVAQEISEASARMNRVIENLLNMSRLNAGALSLILDWVDPSDLVGVILNRNKNFLRNHKIDVIIHDGPILLWADYRLLEFALSNLVLNAIQYSEAGTAIVVKVGRASQWWELSVEDQGSGIPEIYSEKIFDKFFRVPGTRAGGTGLGLSIVKEIMNLHSGEVKYEHRLKGGSRFILLLPWVSPPSMDKEETHDV